MTAKQTKLKMIGWREWVSLPEWDIPAIKVKVDTGARTCALHATRIRYIKDEEGETMVSFLVISRLNPRKIRRVHAPLVAKRKVKSSLGHSTLRPVIRTVLRVGEETFPVEITLVNRDPMGFRMLLGRQCLKGRFLIDPARSFIQSKERDLK
jgi:hypothetical protein